MPQITSPAFQHLGGIPRFHTCDRQGPVAVHRETACRHVFRRGSGTYRLNRTIL